MLYRKTCFTSLRLVLLSALLLGLGACGGSKGFSGDINLSTPVPEPLLQSDTGGLESNRSFPRREFSIAYDSSGYVENGDLRLVPLTKDGQPDRAASPNFGLTVRDSEAIDGSRIATVSAIRAGELHLHLHFDVENWSVQGVGIKNPWRDGREFLSFAYTPQPGVLEIMVQPLGQDGTIEADGELATIRLIPHAQARSMSSQPIGQKKYGAAYLATGPAPLAPVSKGYLSVRLDGSLGKLSSKDNVLSGNELSTEVSDNLAHDVIVENIESTFVKAGQFPENLSISWTERLVGDYDNNGVVNINDITPVATLSMDHNYNPPIPFEPGDPFLVQSASYESGEIDSLWNKMLGNVPLWFNNPNHNLDVFFMADKTNEPSGYDWDLSSYGSTPAHGLTNAMNGADGLWDANVQSYHNWDSDTQIAGLEGDYWFFDGNGKVQWGVPGDLLPMAYHLDEYISGYEVWSIENGLSFNPETPTSMAKHIDRLSGKRFQQNPSDYEGTLYDVYRPWEHGGTLERYRRAAFGTVLTAEDFNLDNTSKYHDIVICPYGFVEDESHVIIKKFGPVSRINKVLYVAPEGSVLDGYGPVYNAGQDNFGIAGMPLALDYENFCFQVWDADDVNNDGAATEPPHKEQVRYQVYAVAEPSEHTGPPLAELLWPAADPEANALSGASWDESGTEGNGSIHSFPKEGDIDLSGSSLPLTEIGRNIWFGIRASAIGPAGSPGELEYTGSSIGTPNTEIMVFKVHEISRPYFVELGSPYQEGAESANDSITTWKPYDNAFGVFFKHGIDPPGFSKEEALEYTLYYSRNEFTANETRKLPLRQDILTKTLPDLVSYNDTLDERGFFDADKLMFYVDVGASTDEYYVYVSVRDNVVPPSSSLNDYVTPGVHARELPSNEISTISSSGSGSAAVVGDIVSEGGDVYVAYSNGGIPYFDNDGNEYSFADLAYQEWRGGNPGLSGNVFISQLGADLEYVPQLASSQLSLDFLRDSNGHIIQNNSQKAAIIGYNAGTRYVDWKYRGAVIANVSGNWTSPSFLPQDPVHEENNFSSRIDSVVVSNYLTKGLGGGLASNYIIPWTACWPFILPPHDFGELRYIRSGSPVLFQPGYFNLDPAVDYYNSFKTIVVGTDTISWPNTYPDVDCAQLRIDPYTMLGQYYRPPTDGQFPFPGTSYGIHDEQTEFFILANSSSHSEENGKHNLRHYSSIKLLYTSLPDGNSPWTTLDLRSVLPGINISGNASGGPNALAVSRNTDGASGTVYVAYADAPNVDRYDLNNIADGKGLRVAYAAFNNGAIGAWNVNVSSDLVSDAFAPPRRNNNDKTFDTVDLAIMPEHFVDDTPFRGIGCIFISGNQLILAESQSVNGEPDWHYHTVAPNGYVIDNGDILWVKLAYVSRGPELPSLPYVFYAIRTSQTTYAVNMWRPGGF